MQFDHPIILLLCHSVNIMLLWRYYNDANILDLCRTSVINTRLLAKPVTKS